ncbi:nuclear transport factor 2 family protein [Halomicroarcula sp. GCM10025709]|uniref:nuclear transport factor 2 family protein n=1 Tax=Haloarcula TaxID=2237 RepID=UPI0024C339DB|nr:nuclear transport factor 2 family protein [Halomicroarcula sp. YJ-61-S]
MEPTELVRAYYRAIDAGEYDSLADLLAAEFVHHRPDRTLDGRDRFVRFMREERPQPDTTHHLDRVYEPVEGGGEVAVRGRLEAADGDVLFGFVDVFTVDGHITELHTYTD